MPAMVTTAQVPRSVNVLRDKYLSLKSRVGRLNEKAKETIEGVVTVLEIQSMAFVFGAVQGAWFEPDPSKPGDKPGAHILGMPVEAVVGAGLIVGGFMGLGGDRWASHLTALGNGALAAWTSNVGRGWGFKWRKERQAKQGVSATRGESLRDEISALLDE